ncbi:MAG: UPF0182 family protein, partial [Acidimicrobiales bacterium]
FHRVWSTILAVKVGLFASFGAAFFVVLWLNLVMCDRITAHSSSPESGDDLVRRYQQIVRPYAGRVYAGLALAVALIAAATTIGQWDNWLLFSHAVAFPGKDPQFGMNDGFFVFRLPFLQFLVDWVLASLIVILLLTALFHYLNGGIRPRGTPRVNPVVKVHLSVLLALVALTKAAGYVLSRYSLDLSTNGYVEGAGYTDVHARLPALDLLFFVSLFATVILLYNIRRQGWTLPVLAVGLWAFVALVIGVIYPAVLQAINVNPAQSKLESPYIARNIAATRYAYGLDRVKVTTFPDSTAVPKTVDPNLTTLGNIRLWDPSPTISLADFRTKQDIDAYYTFQTVQVDRYASGGTIKPAIVGVRQIDPTNLPSKSWVNEHLQYTHGEGLVLAEANQATAKGNPVFSISDVPAKSTSGFPKVKQPAIYFGVNDPGYVIADTRQPELDGQRRTGANVEGHYSGRGGVRLSSFFTRAAFALRLGDLNLLLSNLVTAKSQIMFIRDVRTMAETAAPFLGYDSQPYPVIVKGHIDWVLNAYTTTSNFPYSQNADTQNLPTTSGLPQSYNYVRNSVVVVVNAYSGKMTFYAMDPEDPILRAYESAFPGMFKTSSTEMPASIRGQLRYGNDLFATQAAVYGRYHITSPSQFYTASDAWIVSPTTGVGPPTQTLKQDFVVSPQGQVIRGTYQPMTPVYQVEAEPGQATQSFTVTDAYVPAGGGGIDTQLLRALLVGNSNPARFGELTVYETPPGKSKVGPILVDNEIEETPTISSKITLLNKDGSEVRLGNILPVLVGQSVLYVRPLYVESKTLQQPQLKYVIAVLGQQVRIGSTLGSALNSLLNTNLKSTGGALTTTPTSRTVGHPSPSGATTSLPVAKARALLVKATADFAKAQVDLKEGDLGAYQSEVAAAQAATSKADRYLAGSSGSPSGSGTPAHPPAQEKANAADLEPTSATGLASSTSSSPAVDSGPKLGAVSGLKPGPSSQAGTSGGTATTTTIDPDET